LIFGTGSLFAATVPHPSKNRYSREEFVKLMDRVEAGEISKIVATRWDRIMREENLYLQVKKLLQENGVQLHLLDQGTADFETAAGLLHADMNAIFAIHERRMLRERVQRGHAYRRKKKEAWSRQPFGYQGNCMLLECL
jgi:site-specific DNA recombinase